MNRTGVVGSILLTLVVLAGCGTGQASSPNGGPTNVGLDSISGQVGQLRLLSVTIESPGAPGSIHIASNSAALLLTIANDGTAADVLTGASALGAQQIVLRNGDAPPDMHLEVSVPPGEFTVLREVTGSHLELSQLRQALRTGSDVPVTFQFRDAGPVTLTVPVATYTDVRPDKYLPVAAATR